MHLLLDTKITGGRICTAKASSDQTVDDQHTRTRIGTEAASQYQSVQAWFATVLACARRHFAKQHPRMRVSQRAKSETQALIPPPAESRTVTKAERTVCEGPRQGFNLGRQRPVTVSCSGWYGEIVLHYGVTLAHWALTCSILAACRHTMHR